MILHRIQPLVLPGLRRWYPGSVYMTFPRATLMTAYGVDRSNSGSSTLGGFVESSTTHGGPSGSSSPIIPLSVRARRALAIYPAITSCVSPLLSLMPRFCMSARPPEETASLISHM